MLKFQPPQLALHVLLSKSAPSNLKETTGNCLALGLATK